MGLIFDIILRKKIPNVIIAGDFNSVPKSIVVRMAYHQDWEAEMSQNKQYIGNNFTHNKKELDFIKETLDKMEKRENFENMIKYLMKLSKEIWDKYKIKSSNHHSFFHLTLSPSQNQKFKSLILIFCFVYTIYLWCF